MPPLPSRKKVDANPTTAKRNISSHHLLKKRQPEIRAGNPQFKQQRRKHSNSNRSKAASSQQAPSPAVAANRASLVVACRQSLLNWLKLFRAECQSLHALLRGGLRDNALHNSIFHKQGTICCRLLGLWYRNYKKEVVFHFLQQVELLRKKKRQKKSLQRLMAKRRNTAPRPQDLPDRDATEQKRKASNRQRKFELYAEKQKQRNAKGKRCSRRGKSRSSLRSATKVRNSLCLFLATTAEYRLRQRILLELVKAGWSCAAELQLLRQNTAPVAVGLMAGLSRMHLLMSSKLPLETASDDDDERSGAFGSWLLV